MNTECAVKVAEEVLLLGFKPNGKPAMQRDHFRVVPGKRGEVIVRDTRRDSKGREFDGCTIHSEGLRRWFDAAHAGA